MSKDIFSEYEFSPDEPETIELRDDIDAEVDKLVEAVNNFNKLPDSKKIGKPFDDIIQQKKTCEKMLTDIRKYIDNYNNTIIDTGALDIETCRKRIAEIEKIDVNKLTLNQKLNVFKELTTLKQAMNVYFTNKKMEVKDLTA